VEFAEHSVLEMIADLVDPEFGIDPADHAIVVVDWMAIGVHFVAGIDLGVDFDAMQTIVADLIELKVGILAKSLVELLVRIENKVPWVHIVHVQAHRDLLPNLFESLVELP